MKITFYNLVVTMFLESLYVSCVSCVFGPDLETTAESVLDVITFVPCFGGSPIVEVGS